MSPSVDADEIEVEIRRNGNGSVLAYADRDLAEEAFDNHREVLRSLYDLVDRRHGENGETVARLEVRADGLGEILVRDEYVRDIETERALALADDMRYHADGRELVTDGGEEIPPFVDPNAEYVTCHFCSEVWDPAEVDGFDLSTPEEYYPQMVPVCPEHAEGCR